ncbi:sensor histidine kinase [Bacteroides caccae]|jgi:PAS domain S-box-containing protein|uniref:sensor histidine kinase n=1 Tax=Bacteroides caccae TaxID=47678 RepID=UPI001C8CD4AA|nr:ATP-binding protein [Bacteroides caccae]
MQNNENKTKEELIKIIEQLEKKVEDLSSMQSYPVQERFREKYSTRILDALPDMLTVFDHDANIIELASSPSTNHVEGINADNITHSNVKDILPPEAYESVRQNMDRVILTGESSTSRHDLMLDGILHHYENRIFPLDNEYLLCMCRDISEQWNAEQTNKKQQKELEAARIKAEESDRLKSAFLANMSHEIRTPLNAIVGFSKLVIDAECTNEKEQYAEIIERNSEILLNLFNDILDLSSLEADSLSFNIRPIKLIDICLQLEQQFCYKVKNGTKLILDDVDTELYVSGDWNRIIQIISNLLSNATKFTPKGEIHFGYREKEDFVEFYVKDSGIGIPAERVATIFQRFGKINDFVQGTGLGLTLCRMLVEKMGGRIWLRSQEGKGSRFYFTLPLIRQ